MAKVTVGIEVGAGPGYSYSTGVQHMHLDDATCLKGVNGYIAALRNAIDEAVAKVPMPLQTIIDSRPATAEELALLDTWIEHFRVSDPALQAALISAGVRSSYRFMGELLALRDEQLIQMGVNASAVEAINSLFRAQLHGACLGSKIENWAPPY